MIAYESQALTAVEARYSQIEWEMSAVVWGIEYFHSYLFGTSFRMYTGHKPFVSILSNLHSSSARIERLALCLQPYSLTIEHTEGSTNSTDYLSLQLPESADKICHLAEMSEEYGNYMT